ncbi:uncharacterized oxidoreductase At4g09670-like [Phalaenopsis equestris]|uniref:uncharacterized oxidoreductase At4g09670-like n=1 Tax=Phalaenopsis equestris TaxID=78828 RepID=UPI0009E61A0C|nr:uncharacterized oxidoreductase At4g09670-like [Phalaenopsis equestris]
MEQPIRFGIMGCAAIARKLSRAIKLSSNATIVAVGSRSPDKADGFIKDNGLPENTKVHASYESLLDDPDVDAVYVPLPTSLHLQWAVAAAVKGKHILLEKPAALCVADLDQILDACEANNVQFMDGTVWMHHPRAAKMHDLIQDPHLFGQLKMVNSIASFHAKPEFLHDNIRVRPNLDGLGALGDLGWYCIRFILWTADYELPRTAVAFPNPVKNEAGVLLSCGASLHWENGTVATFHCSFLAHRTFQATAVGSKGTLTLSDFVNPLEEKSAGFIFASQSGFKELITGWKPLPSNHVIPTEIPQEACMISEFSRLVGDIRDGGAKPEKKWASISRKNQVVMDAVRDSIDKGFKPVQIVG